MTLGYVMGFALLATASLLAALRLIDRWLSPSHTIARDMAEENSALRLVRVGQVLAVFFVAASSARNCLVGGGWKSDALWLFAFAFTGLSLVLVTGRAGVALLLAGSLRGEIERGNRAAGLAAGGHYVATGIVTSSSLAGHGLHELSLSLAFFLLAQLTLHLFVMLFRALTTYDDAEQIRGENLAAAISYAGVTVAISLVIARALEGDFTGLVVSLIGYAKVLAFLLVLYPIRQLLVQGLLLGAKPALRGGRLDYGIGAEHNEGMAALEAATYVATALAIAEPP
jgi:uncharacterized membrane protein YjfL (UPF0719 family)